jgi:hypothetical protein
MLLVSLRRCNFAAGNLRMICKKWSTDFLHSERTIFHHSLDDKAGLSSGFSSQAESSVLGNSSKKMSADTSLLCECLWCLWAHWRLLIMLISLSASKYILYNPRRIKKGSRRVASLGDDNDMMGPAWFHTSYARCLNFWTFLEPWSPLLWGRSQNWSQQGAAAENHALRGSASRLP